MPIQIRCPNSNCKKLLRMPNVPARGRRGRCPSCGEMFAIEEPKPDKEAPDPSLLAEPSGLDETQFEPKRPGESARTEPFSQPTPEFQGNSEGPATIAWSAQEPTGAEMTADWRSNAPRFEPPESGLTPPAPPGSSDDFNVYEVNHSAALSGIPSQIGRFQLRRTLGAGGFGTVYLAFDTQLEREVALKVPKAFGTSGKGRGGEVLGEARAAARLRHQAIVQVFEIGSADGYDYIASAFVEGRPISDEIASGGFASDDQGRIARVVRGLAEALAYAHGQGIVHRDVKPANVLLDSRGRPHLTDFGLAVRPEDSVRGGVAGTPAYMSPEQARGEEARPASDQYALGVILYEMLCGRVPFDGKVAAVLHDVVHSFPAPPRSIKKEIHPGLESICLRALSKDPGQRFPNCEAMANALRDWNRKHGRSKKNSDRVVRFLERLPVLNRISTPTLRLALGRVMIALVVLGASGLAGLAFVSARHYLTTGAKVVTARPLDSDDRPRWEARAPGPLADGLFLGDEQELAVLAVGAGQGTWEGESGERLDWSPADRGAIWSIARSPDGRRLALGDDRGVLILQDVQTGRNEQQIAAHAAPISRLAFSPDGSQLVSASWDHTAKLWDVASGREQATLRGHTDILWSVCFRPDGRMVATCGDDRIILWDAETGAMNRELRGHRNSVTGVAFNPSGDQLASSSLDQTVRLWSPNAEYARFELRGPDRPLLNVGWSPDGQMLVACEGDDPQNFKPAARPAGISDLEPGRPTEPRCPSRVSGVD